MSDYLSVTYNEVVRPFTSYPRKLTKYLFDFYNLEKKNTLLDIGAGRGEFLQGFSECGLSTFGVDGFWLILSCTEKFMGRAASSRWPAGMSGHFQ